ncbi:MAG: sporulation transcriptional regulator SpoIIID [Clostridiales bacterium]|nr:sporulation transcriptional regulator SpoIIID [Clostridiales bacterium]
MQNCASLHERCEVLARYLVEESSTVRETAKRFGVSKSTVHKDIKEKLKYVNPSLYAEARIILDRNKLERHIRGGNATKLKYQRIKNAREKQVR